MSGSRLPALGSGYVDARCDADQFGRMNRGQLALEIARRKHPDAVDLCAAIKAEFRREDQALARAGRAREVLERNVALLGMDPNSPRPRLISINGVRFRS